MFAALDLPDYADLGSVVWWAKTRLTPGLGGWVQIVASPFDGVDVLRWKIGLTRYHFLE